MGNVRPQKKQTKGKKRNIKGKNRTLSKKYRNYINKQINKLLRGGSSSPSPPPTFGTDEVPAITNTNQPSTEEQLKQIAKINTETIGLSGENAVDIKTADLTMDPRSENQTLSGDAIFNIDYKDITEYNDRLDKLNKDIEKTQKELTDEIKTIMTNDDTKTTTTTVADNINYFTQYFDKAKYVQYKTFEFITEEDSKLKTKKLNEFFELNTTTNKLNLKSPSGGSTPSIIWFDADALIRLIHPYCELLEERLKYIEGNKRDEFKDELIKYLKMYCDYLKLREEKTILDTKKGIVGKTLSQIKGVFDNPKLPPVKITYNSYDTTGGEKNLLQQFFSNIQHINEYIETLNKMKNDISYDDSSSLEPFYGSNLSTSEQDNIKTADGLVALLNSDIVVNSISTDLDPTINIFNAHLKKARFNYSELLRETIILDVKLEYDNNEVKMDKINEIIKDEISKENIEINGELLNNNNITIELNDLKVKTKMTPELLKDHIISHLSKLNKSLCSLIYAEKCDDVIATSASVTPATKKSSEVSFDDLTKKLSIDENDKINLQIYLNQAFKLHSMIKKDNSNNNLNSYNIHGKSNKDLYQKFIDNEIENIDSMVYGHGLGSGGVSDDYVEIKFKPPNQKFNMKIKFSSKNPPAMTDNINLNDKFSESEKLEARNLIIDAARIGFDNFKTKYELNKDFEYVENPKDTYSLVIDTKPSSPSSR